MTGPAERIVQDYFERMAEIRSTGAATSETSYYGAFENLLNQIGKALKPAVLCNGQLRNQGAGHPDFGFYSKNQRSKGEPKEGQASMPERGVVEVKGLADETWLTAETEQVSTYWQTYRQVLVTNYRDFLLIGEDAHGHSTKLEAFRLANSEAEFWSRLGSGILEPPPDTSKIRAGDRPSVDGISQSRAHAERLAEGAPGRGVVSRLLRARRAGARRRQGRRARVGGGSNRA